MAGVGALLGRFFRTRAWRAWSRVGLSRGNILAAGIAFYGVFSLFPLLVLGFAVLGLVVGGDDRLQDTVVDLASGALPGVIGDETDPARPEGVVSAQDLLSTATDTTVAGVSAALGVLVLLFTGLGWIAALREGIRSMFAMPVMALDPVRAKLFDLAVLLTLGLLIVVTALLSVITQGFTEELLRLVGLEGSQVGDLVTSTIAFAVGVALNTGLFTVLFRVLAQSSAPYRTVVGGAALAALGVVVLQTLVGVLLRGVGGGLGFLAAFVPVLAVFVWLNLNARVMLLGAAWVAVGPSGPDPAVAADTDAVADAFAAGAGTAPRPVAPPFPPVLPARWTDRAVLGAGVVLGATAVGMAHVVGGAVRAAGGGVRQALRRSDHGDDRADD